MQTHREKHHDDRPEHTSPSPYLLPTCIQTRVSLDEPAPHNQKAGGITQCTHYYVHKITGAPLTEQAAVAGTLCSGLLEEPCSINIRIYLHTYLLTSLPAYYMEQRPS